MMTKGERAAAAWAAASRGMKVSSSGRPSMSPPAPRSTFLRVISGDRGLFMASLFFDSGKAVEEVFARYDGEFQVMERHSGTRTARVVVDGRRLAGVHFPTVQVGQHVLHVASVYFLGLRQEFRKLDAILEGLELSVQNVAVGCVHGLSLV